MRATGTQLVASGFGEAITGLEADDPAALQGYYRFIRHQEDSEITCENMLRPHRARTIERMRGQSTVLCIQDGTKFNYATRPRCEGLQVIGRNQTTASMYMHTTMAVTAEGVPLGMLRCGFDAQAKKTEHAAQTQRWMDGCKDIDEAASEVSTKTRIITVIDREADIYALYQVARRSGRQDMVVRVYRGRCLTKEAKLCQTMRGGLADGYADIAIQRLSRRAKSGRQTHKGRTARVAHMEVRWRSITMPPPKGKKGSAIPMSRVHVVESAPPEGEKPVEWFLLTSLVVTDITEAMTVVHYYALRWRIEDFFRILKSGCKVEDRAARTALRLQRTIVMNCVVAWRLMTLTLLGREVPEINLDVMFTGVELRVLAAYARGA